MTIHHGDCLDVMASLDATSVDAIVTDPPYDLLSASRNGSRRINNPDNPAGRTGRGFMGKTWDGTGIAFRPETWAAMLQVAKPGAYLLAFGGTRTYHRMVVAIEDGGWLIRDCLVWVYAQGFPKSRANLKPAWEPIVMARKRGPLRRLAIDACRIGTHGGGTDCPQWPAECSGHGDERAQSGPTIHRKGEPSATRRYADQAGDFAALPGPRGGDPLGRWPSNVVLTDALFDGDAEGVVGGGETNRAWTAPSSGIYDATGYHLTPAAGEHGPLYGDEGTYSRFFLIPKADRDDREPILSPDAERLASGATRLVEQRINRATHPSGSGDRFNTHPTVKPTELMRHLVRLVTPAGGTVLDPFLGSGTTAIAAELEGFPWVGIEREAEYVAIAEARLNGVQKGMGLSA